MQEWVGQVRREGTGQKVADCPSAGEDMVSGPEGVVLMEERDEPETHRIGVRTEWKGQRQRGFWGSASTHWLTGKQAGAALSLGAVRRSYESHTQCRSYNPFLFPLEPSYAVHRQAWPLRTGWPGAGGHVVLLASSHQTHRLPGKADRATVFLWIWKYVAREA